MYMTRQEFEHIAAQLRQKVLNVSTQFFASRQDAEDAAQEAMVQLWRYCEQIDASRNIDVLGRDLMSPDEVRKLDNKKCLIFVKGYDPVLDDKYRTYEKDEFRRANAMGAYTHHFQMDDRMDDSFPECRILQFVFM